MGKRDRMHKEAVALGKSKSLRARMQARANLIALEKAINMGVSKQVLMDGARKGLEDHAHKLAKEGRPLTMVSVMEELDTNPDFFRIVARADISRGDIEAVAKEVIGEKDIA